ncbi:hypothetical protein JTE90_027645 [Oedothorax gibbosus]|uniref:Uncharacterized protein n=1 Tax=Oedothorax gibbosus TaxID=931172 RepID=A0AAV6UR63_9ARAC|nr:hypothetical protein JTE90_027645 [Oedothorax gibbosus]
MSRSIPSTSRACNWSDDFVPEEIWLHEEDNTTPFEDKAESKDSEMGLYDELFESDMKRSKEKTKVASNYEDLQKQISHLKSLVAEKDSKLTTMTQHYTNVKKNICSLYKTAKIEIDHKDALLAEANSRLDELLFQRNMTVDQLEKQNPSASHNKSLKSKEVMPAKRENPKESEVPSKSLSNNGSRTADQPSAKRICLGSPTTPTSTDNKRTEPENRFQNKKHKCESKNSSKSPNSDIQNNLNKKQNPKSTTTIQTCDAKVNQDIALSNVNSFKKNRDSPGELSSELNQEPSIAEVFAKMQELAFKDPEATNAVFFNLLPAELRDSFLAFEQTQANALNKLKQSFVSCYFSQCGAGMSEDVAENEPQSSTSFFFSQPKSESCSSPSVAVHNSDTESKAQENTSGPKRDPDLQKSRKRSTSTMGLNSPDSKSMSEDKHNEVKISDLQTSRRRSTSKVSLNSSDSKSTSSENHTEVKIGSDFQTSRKRSTSTKGFNSPDSKSVSQESHSEVKNSSDLQKSRKISTLMISPNSKSKPQENISQETEVSDDGDLPKSSKKSTKRHKSPKKTARSYKYNDDKLTLYTQRQLKRR